VIWKRKKAASGRRTPKLWSAAARRRFLSFLTYSATLQYMPFVLQENG